MPWEKNFDIDQTLDKAMRLFWAHGYDGTSMQDLIQGMGIHRGSLYGTFGDKRSLFIAALLRYDNQCRKTRLAELEQMDSAKAAIKALFQGWINLALADPNRSGCFLTNTALELAVHDEEIGAIVASSQKETEAFFHRLLQKGQASGEIPEDTNPMRAAQSLLAALLGLLVLARSRPERSLLQSIAESALASLK